MKIANSTLECGYCDYKELESWKKWTIRWEDCFDARSSHRGFATPEIHAEINAKKISDCSEIENVTRRFSHLIFFIFPKLHRETNKMRQSVKLHTERTTAGKQNVIVYYRNT